MSENLWFSFSGGIEMEHWAKMGEHISGQASHFIPLLVL